MKRSVVLAGINILIFLIACPLLSISQDLDSLASGSIQSNIPPRWLHPCSPRNFGNLRSDLNQSDQIFSAFGRVVNQARLTLESIEEVATLWGHFAFHEDFKTLLQKLAFRLPPSTFLPNIADTTKFAYGPIVEVEYATRKEIMLNLYRWLQQVAVGLEQLIADQFKYKEPYAEAFSDTYTSLILLLCQLDALIFVEKLQKHPDVHRNSMSDANRIIESLEARRTRDFQIVMEYINIVQYTEEAITRFSRHRNNK